MFAPWKLEGQPDRVRRVNNYELELEFSVEAQKREKRVLQIKQSWEALGTCVWDGALVMLHWLGLENNVGMVRGMNVIDIGAGTGVAGLAAAAMGAKHVDVTDLPICLSVINQSVKLNKMENVCSVMELDLSKKPGPPFVQQSYDLILLAEVMYVVELAPNIVQWVKYLLKPDGVALLSYGRNGKASPQVFKMLEEIGLQLNQVSFEEQHPYYQASDCFLFVSKYVSS